ncbi:hypothetical protein ACLKA6_000863 [Drosophila palustris]
MPSDTKVIPALHHHQQHDDDNDDDDDEAFQLTAIQLHMFSPSLLRHMSNEFCSQTLGGYAASNQVDVVFRAESE